MLVRSLRMLVILLTSTAQCGLVRTRDSSTPTFPGPLLGVISETDQVGSVLLNLQAFTGDSNTQINYELIDNPHDYFALDQTSGNLTIAKELDRLALAPPNNVLTLTVTARAGSGKH